MKFDTDLSSSELVTLANTVRKELELDKALKSIGTPHLVGSAALDLGLARFRPNSRSQKN